VRLGARLGLPLVVVAALVACADLFDEASQCSSDADCARFSGAVCDVASRICVLGGVDAESEDAGSVPIDAEAAETAPNDRCNVSPKPTSTIGEGVDGGADGGARAEITANVTLGCDKDWTLDALLFVRSGATLTIEAGTTIRAKKGVGAGIVVSPGGRIVAEGAREAPIVITSDAPEPAAGDWRGVFLLGLAPPSGEGNYQNDPDLAWGGANPEDDSGVLSFVRIEYAEGGLAVAGAGRKTKIDYVQVRRTVQNCFMFQGGTVDVKHLVCQSPGDDQFEWYLGYEGRAQFLFGQKTAAPPVFGAHGLLVDDAKPVIYNATFCGDAVTPNGYGLLLRDDGTLDLNGAIVTGWFAGLDVTGSVPTPGNIRGSILSGNGTDPAYAESAAEMNTSSPAFDDDNGFDERAWFEAPLRGNAVVDPKLVDCFDAKSPKPWPQTPLATKPPAPPNDGFFDPDATYAGAFSGASDAWMTGAWVRFDDR